MRNSWAREGEGNLGRGADCAKTQVHERAQEPANDCSLFFAPLFRVCEQEKVSKKEEFIICFECLPM